MNDQLRIIKDKLGHLSKMRGYLAYSLSLMIDGNVASKDISNLSDADANTFAAFRMRFSEYQEHIGKLIKAIAIDQDVKIVGRSDLTAFAEKVGILKSEDDWNIPRNIRNDINHSYIDDADELRELTEKMVNESSTLFLIHNNAINFCKETYNVEPCHICGQVDCVC